MPTSNGITTYLIVVYKEGNNEGKKSRKTEVTTDGSWPAERDGLRAYSFPEYAHTTGEAPRSGFAQGLFQSTFKVIKSSLTHHLKNTNLESTVAVYVPLLPHTIGFKIGFGFIPNFPEGVRFLARIKFNGTLVAQVCIKPQQQPNGVISRILAEVSTGHKSKDAPTLQEFEFEFAPKSGIFRSTAEEGGDIEISWHRVLGSALSKSDDTNRIKSFKEKFQIKLKPAGEAVGVLQRKLYLVDPIDEPFASQKWYYRTARSLQESQIMSPDHDLYTQLPPIGDRGSLEHHVDRKARENPQNQKRTVSVSGPFYLNPGLSLGSSSTGSAIHHNISATTEGARRCKITREVKRNPGRDRQENSGGDQTRSRRHSIASISPSINFGADLSPITLGTAKEVLLSPPETHQRNRNNGRHMDLSGQFARLRANDDGGSLQGSSTDEDGQTPLIAPQPRSANTLYQHGNAQFGYGLSSSPILEDDDASVLSTVDRDFVRSGLTAAPREQHALPGAPPTTPEQTQTFTSNIPQTPGSPLDGVSYPVMTPGSHNLPVIEPGDRLDLSPEKADDMSPHKSPEKNFVSGFSPEKSESPGNQAGFTLFPYKSPARVESPATATASRILSDVVRRSPFNQMEDSRISGPISLSISRERAHAGHRASNSGSIPSSPGSAEVSALERQVSGQVQRRVSKVGSQQQAPPPSRNSSILSSRGRLQIPPSFGGDVQRAQSQLRGIVRSPSKTASLFKEGVASVRRQLGISESGMIEASGLQGVDENIGERRSEGRERKKLSKRSSMVSKPSKNPKDERRGEYDVFATNGAAVDTGVALGGSGSGVVTAQSFGVARNYGLPETAPIGSRHRVHGERDPFISPFNTGAATLAALNQTAVDVGSHNISATSQLSRVIMSGGVYAANSSRDFEPADVRDDADAEPISPCTAALNGLAAFGERLESGQSFISKEKKEKATAVKSEGHAAEEGKKKQKTVEKNVNETEERAAEEAKIRDALKLAFATVALEANFTSQDAPRTPENTLPVPAAARYPRRQSSLNQLRPRPLLEDSPPLTTFGGVLGRANRHYYTNTPRSHADRARQEVQIQDQAHIHPPPRRVSHSHPSPPAIGHARLIDIPAISPPIRNRVPHGHPDSTPAGSPRPEGFDDLYNITPPGTPRRRSRHSALVPASVQGSPTREANISAACVQIRDASNAANLFRAAPRLSPPAAPPAPRSSPVLPVPGAWPRERREASEQTIREREEGEEVVLEAGEVERDDHVFASPAPGDYSLMFQM